MTSRFFVFVLVTVFGSISLNGYSSAQQTTGENNAFADILKSTSEGLSDESIDEILRIRKRLGGGTGLELTDQLERDSASCPACSESDSRICRLDVTDDLPDPASATTRSERLFFEMLQSEKQLQIRSGGCSELTAEQGPAVRGFRDVVRRMDQLAADLEDLNLFEEADDLRLRAARIRNAARNAARPVWTDGPIRR